VGLSLIERPPNSGTAKGPVAVSGIDIAPVSVHINVFGGRGPAKFGEGDIGLGVRGPQALEKGYGIHIFILISVIPSLGHHLSGLQIAGFGENPFATSWKPNEFPVRLRGEEVSVNTGSPKSVASLPS